MRTYNYKGMHKNQNKAFWFMSKLRTRTNKHKWLKPISILGVLNSIIVNKRNEVYFIYGLHYRIIVLRPSHSNFGIEMKNKYNLGINIAFKRIGDIWSVCVCVYISFCRVSIFIYSTIISKTGDILVLYAHLLAYMWVCGGVITRKY